MKLSILSLSTNSARAALMVTLVVVWTGIIFWTWWLGRSPAIIAGVMLAAYLVAPLYAMLIPVKQHDPAMGAPRGCLAAIILLIVIIGAILIVGVTLGKDGLVWTAFIITLLPLVAVSIGAIVYVIRLMVKKE